MSPKSKQPVTNTKKRAELLFACNLSIIPYALSSLGNDVSQNRIRTDIIPTDELGIHLFISTLCHYTITRFYRLCTTKKYMNFDRSPYNYDVINSILLESKVDVCVAIGFQHSTAGHIFAYLKINDQFYKLESHLYYNSQTMKQLSMPELIEDHNFIKSHMVESPYNSFHTFNIPDSNVIKKNANTIKKTMYNDANLTHYQQILLKSPCYIYKPLHQ